MRPADPSILYHEGNNLVDTDEVPSMEVVGHYLLLILAYSPGLPRCNSPSMD